MKNKIFTLLLITFFLGVLITSCEKEKVYRSDQTTTEEFYTIMNQWYYWKDSIGDVDPDLYSSPVDLLETMRYQPRDKWSYITTQEEHSQYYEEGAYVGYGFSYAPDETGNVRIAFLYDDSDFKAAGVDRGWIIKKINDVTVDQNADINSLLGANSVGVANKIEFQSPTGEIISDIFAKKVISMNTVGYENTFDVGTKKVGYFVFESFIGPSLNELTDVFNYFKTEGVNELVVDLRYNGGGRMDVVIKLAGLIIPDHVNGEVFIKYEHNEDRTRFNESVPFEQEAGSLKLNKIYFLTSKGSASASEVIINSLDPYLDVYTIGDDTYGKPVGMYSFVSNVSNLVYAPVAFKMVNADEYGGYYGGLKADSYAEDELSAPFGLGEAMFDEALYHIENGSFNSLKSAGEIYRAPVKEIRTIKEQRGTI